jgi:hypothetical protein
MKPPRLSRVFSITMSALGLCGALYSAIEWIRGPASNSVKYEILLVMWLALGIGWGSRLLPEGAVRRRDAAKRSSTAESREDQGRE